jgi:hypothetical protein
MLKEPFQPDDMASVVALTKREGTGPVGHVLSLLPDWLLRAADKWAQQDADYQESHQDPNRLPLPNPWQFLLEAPCVSKEIKEVCRAAQSQLHAFRHLCGMALERASLNTDWFQAALAAQARGDTAAFDSALAKVADSLVQFDFVQRSVRDQNDPELLQAMESWRTKRREQLIHRGRGSETKSPRPKPSWTEIRDGFPVECCLVEGWVTLHPYEAPGLMFWSNRAITEWLFARLGRDPKRQKNLGRDYIKKIRQQLGLIPVSEKCPLVWNVTVKPLPQDQREIIGRQRDGKALFKYTMRTTPRG